MHQYLGHGVLASQLFQLQRLEFFVHHATPLPEQHVGTSLLLHVLAQVTVWCPKDLFTPVLEVLNYIHRATRGDHPVSPRLNFSAGIGIHHHGVIRVLITKGREFINRATDIQGTLGI